MTSHSNGVAKDMCDVAGPSQHPRGSAASGQLSDYDDPSAVPAPVQPHHGPPRHCLLEAGYHQVKICISCACQVQPALTGGRRYIVVCESRASQELRHCKIAKQHWICVPTEEVLYVDSTAETEGKHSSLPEPSVHCNFYVAVYIQEELDECNDLYFLKVDFLYFFWYFYGLCLHSSKREML